MSNIDNILNRLDKVKSRGGGKHVALCPCHNEKTPSLNITDLGDERIIMHCFGCGANGIDVIRALELKPDALFPENPDYKDKQGYKRDRIIFPAKQVLQSLLFESTIVLLASKQVLEGKKLNAKDCKRLELANNRIYEAVNYAKEAG